MNKEVSISLPDTSKGDQLLSEVQVYRNWIKHNGRTILS